MATLRTATRQAVINIRSRLSTQYQENASNIICKKIRSLYEYRYAKKIALYHCVRGEVDLGAIFKSAPLQGKQCYFPVMSSEDGTNLLQFLPAHAKTVFTKNKYSIMQPQVELSHAIPPNEIDIIFLPLVAFDNYGNRLGMGAGYYDNTLIGCRDPLLIGVGYDFQKQAYIPPRELDVKLDMIITNKGIIRS